MLIKSIKIVNYRNIKKLQFNPSPGINLFYGENGAGKTNLLESIFTLCLGRSQKGAADNIVLRSEADYYRIEGEIENKDREKVVAVAYEKGGRKRVQINGAVCRNAELFEHFSAVAAGPEDDRIIAGSPSARRLFIDMYLSQMSPSYLENLSRYQKILAQKNAALKNRMEPGPFDDLLVDTGCKVIAARSGFLSKLAVHTKEAYLKIAGGEELKIYYQPSVPVAETISENMVVTEELTASFRSELDQKRERENSLRISIVGPHRDDLGVEIGGLPARSHGSQGQWRTAAIALKLGVYHLLSSEKGTAPLLLFDEIFAELDSRRSVQLMHMFDNFSQLFITMAMSPPVGMREAARCYRVSGGKIQETI